MSPIIENLRILAGIATLLAASYVFFCSGWFRDLGTGDLPHLRSGMRKTALLAALTLLGAVIMP